MEKFFQGHPAQLYEAFGYLLLFILLWKIYWKTDLKKYKGFIFGLFLTCLFSIRVLVEYVKESQGGFEEYFRNSIYWSVAKYTIYINWYYPYDLF